MININTPTTMWTLNTQKYTKYTKTQVWGTDDEVKGVKYIN